MINAGNVATQTDARSTVTAYTYDTLNRVTAATVTDGTVTYEYDNITTGGDEPQFGFAHMEDLNRTPE